MFVSHERAVFMTVFSPTYIPLLFRRTYEIGMGNVAFQTALGGLGLYREGSRDGFVFFLMVFFVPILFPLFPIEIFSGSLGSSFT